MHLFKQRLRKSSVEAKKVICCNIFMSLSHHAMVDIPWNGDSIFYSAKPLPFQPILGNQLCRKTRTTLLLAKVIDFSKSDCAAPPPLHSSKRGQAFA